jgi:addiction module RelE/StbE family toxin
MQSRQIKFTKSFTKEFKVLRKSQKERFYDRLELFKKDPLNKVLRDHALKGKYIGYRSIDIGGDLRALHYVDGSIIVIFAFIGSHSQLY